MVMAMVGMLECSMICSDQVQAEAAAAVLVRVLAVPPAPLAEAVQKRLHRHDVLVLHPVLVALHLHPVMLGMVPVATPTTAVLLQQTLR